MAFLNSPHREHVNTQVRAVGSREAAEAQRVTQLHPPSQRKQLHHRDSTRGGCSQVDMRHPLQKAGPQLNNSPEQDAGTAERKPMRKATGSMLCLCPAAHPPAPTGHKGCSQHCCLSSLPGLISTELPAHCDPLQATVGLLRDIPAPGHSHSQAESSLSLYDAHTELEMKNANVNRTLSRDLTETKHFYLQK